MFTLEYKKSAQEIAQLIGKDTHVKIGICKKEPRVGEKLNCTSYCFMEGCIAVAPQSGVEVKSVEAITDGLSLVWAMEPTCVDDVGPYPYVVATRIRDRYKIAPTIDNHLCNLAFTTEKPEVGKGGNLMVVHFQRIGDYQMLTPIRIDTFEEVVPIGKGVAWVRVKNFNKFSLDFFVKFPVDK